MHSKRSWEGLRMNEGRVDIRFAELVIFKVVLIFLLLTFELEILGQSNGNNAGGEGKVFAVGYM